MRRLLDWRLWLIFILLFMIITLITPPNPTTLADYNLTTKSYRTLLFATAGIPAFMTWFAALYGYEQFRRFTPHIAKSREADAFSDLLQGSRWTALYLPIVVLTSLLLLGLGNAWPGFHGAALVLSNYVAEVLGLVAFMYVSSGARKMADSVSARPTLARTRALTLIFIIMGVLYSYYVIEHALRQTNPYHLPVIMILLTVVVPYFFAWYMGLLAILDIEAYAQKVPGILYRKALRLFSSGLLIIIISSILLQYLHSANPDRGRLVLGDLLLLGYILYGAMATGFLMIGASAKKLQQIEQI